MLRNKKVFFYLTIFCLILIIAACAGKSNETPAQTASAVPTVTPEPTNAEDALKEYAACINAKNYEAMFGMLSNQSDVSKDDFITRNKNIYEGIEAENVTVEIDGAMQGDTISYKTTMDTLAGQISFTNKAVLKQTDGVYKLQWNSNMIFPNLNDDDKVRVDTTAGKRGNILDRNGKLLAGEDNVYSVGIVPGKLNPDTRDQDIATVAGLLNMTPDDINGKLSENWVKDNLFVPLKKISYTDTDKKTQLLAIKGVGLNTVKERVYALGEKAAHLTGYVQSITQKELDANPDKGYDADSKIGKVGLESLLEDRIRAVDGFKIYIVDKDNKEKETLAQSKAKNGEDVTLTIDSALQEKLYDQMKNDKGAAVVMDPKTGEILALVSTPSYDPNDFILGMTEEKWAAYNNEETQPMVNRFKGTYAPGSSFKPITAAVGLSKGSFTAQDDFGPSGQSWQKDSTWGNYTVTTLKKYSGPANVLNALINSDNIFFAKAALKIGADAFAGGLKSVGFGEDVPFEFGLTDSTFGTNLTFDDEVGLADSGYGQGKVLINPVHMASIYSAFVNQGNMITPHLEKATAPKVWKENVFTADAVATVKNAMVQVIESASGTGHSFKINGLKMAGKTGTAEIKKSKEDTTGTELGWFVAYPADDSQSKQYLTVAMIQDVKDRGGSHYVIPIVRALYADK